MGGPQKIRTTIKKPMETGKININLTRFLKKGQPFSGKNRPSRLFINFFLASLIVAGGIFPDFAHSEAPASLFDPSAAPPNEIDLGTGLHYWSYSESIGDSDSATMIPVKGRAMWYWTHFLLGIDLSYEPSISGSYNGYLQASNGNSTPYSSKMAENMDQEAGHIGTTFVFWGTRFNLWASVGNHQQIWMTPGPYGYTENYDIPYWGGTIEEISPLTDGGLVLFSELGFREAFSPSITVGAYNDPTLSLGGASNAHGILGLRYYFVPRLALYTDLRFSAWNFTQSGIYHVPNSATYIQEPNSQTFWWGPDIGITFDY